MAYFAMFVVAVTVFMLVLVVSVMSGFLAKIETAAKGLFGDIVMESSLGGVGRYDEFIAELATLKDEQGQPIIEAASPFILTLGVLQIPQSDVRELVQIAGIRPAQAAAVTDFEKGLTFQKGVPEPTFNPPIPLLQENLAREMARTEGLLKTKAVASDPTIQRWVQGALYRQEFARRVLEQARPWQEEIDRLYRQTRQGEASASQGADTQKASEKLDELIERAGYQSPDYHIILGLGIRNLSFRTEAGDTVRFLAPGHKVELMVAPLGRRVSRSEMTPNVGTFTVVDDCRTDVSSIDSELVYVPFDTLQKLNNMTAEYSADEPGKVVTPARCSQIHIKVAPRYSGSEQQLQQVRDKVQQLWDRFSLKYPDAATVDVGVQTWRQRQAAVVEPIEKQRTLTILLFSVMYVVSVIIIIVIFYTIVMHKTRDIGVLKAIGASSWGVTAIFLGYGAAVGVVGSLVGVVGGFFFVKNINPIQDWMAEAFNFRVWSREVFLFEKIPNQMDWSATGWIVLGAIAAGLVGALIPAVLAARMQPVRALRYE